LLVAAGIAQPVCAAKFKFATIAPEGSQWMQDMRGAATEIKARTDGRVSVKLYGGGVMGNDKKVLRKIRIGQLQGGAFTSTGLAERYPDIVLYGLPLLFGSQDEVDFVRERMDALLEQGLEDSGFVSFGFAGGGFAKLMGDRPARGLEDLRGRKVWVPEGDPISYAAMEALRLSPVVLPITDVLMGLQTGLLEYVATPPVGAVVLQWYTKVKYVTSLPIAYTLGVMVVEKRAFQRLSNEDQVVFRDVMRGIYEGFDTQNRRDNREAEEALRANGLQVVDPDPAQVPEWRRVAAETNQRLGSEGAFSTELLRQLLDHLEEYRSQLEQKRPRAAFRSGQPYRQGQRPAGTRGPPGTGGRKYPDRHYPVGHDSSRHRADIHAQSRRRQPVMGRRSTQTDGAMGCDGWGGCGESRRPAHQH
jgi:TRAP-type C4-dicarboxylate transport system substrate-binding protein